MSQKILQGRKIVAGLDIGNGYTKCSINGEKVFAIPSSVAHVTHTHDMKAADIGGTVLDIFNEMDARFDSPTVKSVNTRRFFGNRGLMSGKPMQEYDVIAHVSKADNDLSGILALGTLAGRSLQYWYEDNGTLPDDMVNVQVDMALALPISEYRKHRYAYAKAFLEGDHYVTLENFDKPVRFRFLFDSVHVFAEGESAQYGMLSRGEDFMTAMLEDMRKLGDPVEGITAADVMRAKNTIGIDIGEGTTNFPVFQSGRFNPDASMTCPNGYGSILTRSMDRLRDDGYSFSTRKLVTEFLIQEPTPMKKAMYNKVSQVIAEESMAFAEEVNIEFVKLLNRVGTTNEAVFVYGGGATELQSILHPMLMDTVRSFGQDGVPVLYMDSRYSRLLNSVGLYEAARVASEKSQTAVPKKPEVNARSLAMKAAG